jgi:signal transduction histidine kinase
VAKDLREEERAEARLKELQRRLAMAEESERSRIAREIHDDLSQRLAATSMNTATIRARLPEGVGTEVPSLLTGLHDDLERLMADIHALSRQLHPTVLDDLGLSKAIGSECDRQGSLTDARIAFLGPELNLKLPSDIGLAFFRITQESIRNAIKHANPSKVEVRLEQVGSRLRLSVVDDGDGFEMKDGRDDSSAGLGLVSMQERARLMGADFEMTSAPGRGTQITVEVSLESPSNSPTGP